MIELRRVRNCAHDSQMPSVQVCWLQQEMFNVMDDDHRVEVHYSVSSDSLEGSPFPRGFLCPTCANKSDDDLWASIDDRIQELEGDGERGASMAAALSELAETREIERTGEWVGENVS